MTLFDLQGTFHINFYGNPECAPYGHKRGTDIQCVQSLCNELGIFCTPTKEAQGPVPFVCRQEAHCVWDALCCIAYRPLM